MTVVILPYNLRGQNADEREELLGFLLLKMDILPDMSEMRLHIQNPRKIMASGVMCLLMVCVISPALADDAKSLVSVEENMREMDKDKDGMVSVQEVRAALEARHGNGYEQALLADLEASAAGRSCSTPFAQNFY